MCSTKIFLAMIFCEIKRHVNTFLGLGDASPASPLCPRLNHWSSETRAGL